GHVDQQPPAPGGTPPGRGLGRPPAGRATAALGRVAALASGQGRPVVGRVSVTGGIPVAGLISVARTPGGRAEGDGVRIVAVWRGVRVRGWPTGPRVLLGRLPPAACVIALVLSHHPRPRPDQGTSRPIMRPSVL